MTVRLWQVTFDRKNWGNGITSTTVVAQNSKTAATKACKKMKGWKLCRLGNIIKIELLGEADE